MEETRRVFKYVIGERTFSFDCDPHSKIWEAKDALCHFIGDIIDLEKVALEQMAQKQIAESMAQSASEPVKE